jgi:hypothetical protein
MTTIVFGKIESTQEPRTSKRIHRNPACPSVAQKILRFQRVSCCQSPHEGRMDGVMGRSGGRSSHGQANEVSNGTVVKSL